MAEETNETAARSEVGQLQNELAETKNKHLRALADFDNFKKRTAAEKEQFVLWANEGLITDLLPTLDGLGRAQESAAKIQAEEELLKGLALIKKQLEDILKKYGVEEIAALGKIYDPNLHEAILQKESNEPEHTIVEEMQKGYQLNGKVIRPAMVIVSKNKKGAK